jgi:Tol biopolymer transport system component
MHTHIRQQLVIVICILSLILISCAAEPMSHTGKLVLKVERSDLIPFPVIRSYVTDIVGNGEIAVKLPRRLGDHPEWSPDGQWITFDTLYLDGVDNSSIYVMRADGKRRIRISNPQKSSFRPTWSPDGTNIAYFSRDDQTGIYIVNVSCILQDHKDCSLAPTFFGEGDSPDWSSDGSYIVYQLFGYGLRDDKIQIKKIDGSEKPIDITPPNTTYCNDPHWSPDGTKVVVGCDANIYVMDADGSNVKQLTTSQNGGNAEPTWSSDGIRILFTSSRDGLGECIGGLCGSGGIYSDAVFLMNADGTNIVRVSLRNDESVLWYEWIP